MHCHTTMKGNTVHRSEMSVGGTGSHGRKRRTAGHLQAVISRAQVTEQVIEVATESGHARHCCLAGCIKKEYHD